MIAALHARMSGHPVRLFLTREEAFLSVGNRPAHKMTVKARIKEDGILTAVTPVRMLNLLSERLSRPKSAHFQFVENELKIMDTAPFMVGPPACEPAKKTAAQP